MTVMWVVLVALVLAIFNSAIINLIGMIIAPLGSLYFLVAAFVMEREKRS